MYTIRYDVRIQDDVVDMPRATRDRIQNTIKQKLTAHPEIFGKPLRHTLAHFRSLRIGEYRVVYLIEKKEVLVLVIAHRRHVYDLVIKRLW